MSRPDVASGQGGQPGANPFLPEWEYVPDGEPHVFGDRVYLYGSHDRFGAPIFCVGDYVCWSAPVDDLAAWREEGVIYRRGQDPANRLGLRLLFAPDVARGADGRYYLFYAFDFMGTIGVAVCDSPAGRYEYLGRVHYPDGTPYGRRAGDGFAFDPAVLADDDGRVWLHTGDLGKMDEDGFVYFSQRIKRMIITSGYNVYPGQLENIIDGYEKVLLSCVIGVKDPYKMQKVKAFVVLRPGYEPSDAVKEEILAYCRQHIAKYAMPYDIEFRAELPKTLVGKVAYRVLEEEEAERQSHETN